MKIVVIGGTGLIGSKVVAGLTDDGHEVVPASPRWHLSLAATGDPAPGRHRRRCDLLGAVIDELTLVPGEGAPLRKICLEWLRQGAAA